MVSPGDAASTAAWIDWPGRTVIVTAAPAAAGKPTTAAPATSAIATTCTPARLAIAASLTRSSGPGTGSDRPPTIKVHSKRPCATMHQNSHYGARHRPIR